MLLTGMQSEVLWACTDAGCGRALRGTAMHPSRLTRPQAAGMLLPGGGGGAGSSLLSNGHGPIMAPVSAFANGEGKPQSTGWHFFHYHHSPEGVPTSP